MGLIICPSRELARQTHEVVEGYTTELFKQGMAEMRIMLCMGGVDGRGLHSSTFQLNLSHVWSLKPQQASSSQLNLRRFCP